MYRPTTPLRRTNSRQSDHEEHYPVAVSALDSAIGNQIAELADGMATLDRNLKDLQVIHTNVNNFNESFSTLIYGLQMNAWCAEFHNGPRPCDFSRRKELAEMEELAKQAQLQAEREERERLALQQIQIHQETPTRSTSEPSDGDVTYMRNDNSFIIQPPSSGQSQLPTRIPQSSRGSRVRPPNLRAPRARGSYLRGSTRGTRGARDARGSSSSTATTRRWL